MISSAVCIQHTKVLDRWTGKQTDGHRTTTKTVCLRIASSNKNESQCLQLCNSMNIELCLYQRKMYIKETSPLDSGHIRLYHQAEPVT